MRTGNTGIDQITGRGFVSIGYIVKTWGIKGDVKVKSLTDVPGRYNTLKKVYIQNSAGKEREYCVESVRKIGGGLIISFMPNLSVSEAGEIVGKYITIPESEVPRLGKDCYYHFDIINMDVYTDDNKYLGKIVDILSTGSNDVYVAKNEEGEYLIPAIHDVVKEVDTKGKRMVVSLMEGLI